MCCCGTKPQAEVKSTLTDVVCGMQVDPATAAGVSEYGGKRYFFCSAGCKRSFDASPEKYT